MKKPIRRLMYGIDRILGTPSGVIVLFIPALIIVLSFMALDFAGVYEIEQGKLQEKITDYSGRVDQICTDLDEYSRKGIKVPEGYYAGVYKWNIEYMDALPMTFAALYDEDLKLLSKREESITGSPFDPTTYKEFIDSVSTSQSGTLVVNFAAGDVAPRDMYIYYRWSNLNQDAQYLLAIAISKYTVSTQTAEWLLWGSIARNIIVTIYLLLMVAYINHIGLQYKERSKKWTV